MSGEAQDTRKSKRQLVSSDSDKESPDDDVTSDNCVMPTEESSSEPKTQASQKKSTRKRKVIKIDVSSRMLFLKKKKKKYGEINKHLDNIKTILLNSNATPIKCKRGIWYSCCFCKNHYLEPADLKIHTIETHDDDDKSDFMKETYLTNFVVKLDVTCLECNCGTQFANLDELTDHLVEKHGKTFHKDIKSQILPFRLDSGLLNCVICETVFNSFKLMIEHMNLHYPNYVCAKCGNGFVNQEKLQVHSVRHRNEGVYNCSFCSKAFISKVRQKEHERQVHITQNKRNKCGLCGEKFGDYVQKYKHEEEVHGVKKTLLQCQACDKSFNNQRALTAHKKTFHLMQTKKKTVFVNF